MREIKFRGLNKDGVWVYGDLTQTKPNAIDGDRLCWIKKRTTLGLGSRSTPTESFTQVNPNSIGQYTGIKDKSGVEIYEGDIIAPKSSIGKIGKKYYSIRHVITWHDTGLRGKQIGIYGSYIGIEWFTQGGSDPFVVIGNIHQNPELLEQSDE